MAAVLAVSQDLSIAKVSDCVLNSKFTTRTEHPAEDIFALGLIAFQLANGRIIWNDESYLPERAGLGKKRKIFIDEKKVRPDRISDKRLRCLFERCVSCHFLLSLNDV